jgi:hypothetical protein
MKHRSTPATVIGAALLLAGVAGVATASSPGSTAKPGAIKPGSITSLHIKNGTVTKLDLAKKVRADLAAPKAHFAAPENSTNIPLGDETQVLTQTLPAGAYAVQANLVLYSTTAGIGSCSLLVDSDAYNIAQVTFPAGGARASLSLSSLVFTAPGKQPSIACATPGTGNASEIRMTAIEVTP